MKSKHSSAKLNDKSLDKLAFSENKRPSACSLYSKFRGSSIGLEQQLFSVPSPHKLNVASDAHLNSFYKKTSARESVHQSSSRFPTMQNQGNSKINSYDTPTSILSRNPTLPLDVNSRAKWNRKSVDQRRSNKEPENLLTHQGSEFFTEVVTVKDRIAELNAQTCINSSRLKDK